MNGKEWTNKIDMVRHPKRTLISFALIAVMIGGGSISAYAEDDDAKALEPNLILENALKSISPGMDFTGKTISLSLDEAVKTMQTTGPGFEAAVLKKESSENSAQKYGESSSSIRELLRAKSQLAELLSNPNIPQDQRDQLEATYLALASIDTSGEDQAKFARDFLREQAPRAFQADLNGLESSTIKSYYGVLLAQERLRIEQENLEVQKDIYNKTQKKFELGVAAKIDINSANSAVEDAKSSVQSSEINLKLARMQFNIQLGYPIMQDVKLTDTLKQVDPPTLSLANAVTSALENRNELREAKFNVDLNKLAMNTTSARYPVNSATYKVANAKYQTAQKTYRDAYDLIEMDIRNQYLTIQNGNAEISSAQATLKNAEEALRLAQISYDAGVKSLTEVQESQVAAHQAALDLSDKINLYDLAVYKIKFAAGVGATAESKN